VQDVLRLDIISRFSTEGFHALTKLNDEIAAAWRAIDAFNGDSECSDWAVDLSQRANCSTKTVYRRRREWLDEYGIDIKFPYAFYRDFLFYGRNSIAPPAARSAVVDAVDSGDGAEAVRALRDAARDFDERRRAVLTTTIKAPPRAMEVRVIAAPGQAQVDEIRSRYMRRRLRSPEPTS
jgi:hypothetical protein